MNLVYRLESISVDAWPIIRATQFGFSPEGEHERCKNVTGLVHRPLSQGYLSNYSWNIVYAHSLKVEDFIWKAKYSGKVFPLLMEVI